MAALLGARSGLPEFFTSADSRPNPVVAAFEKELGSFIASLKRVEKRATTAQSRQKAFNTLFNLWNSYEGRLATSYFTQQLLATGDALCQAKEYALAQTHCYGRCLGSLGLRLQEEGRVEEYFQDVEEDAGLITTALRAIIGDAMCQFYLTEREDPRLMHDPSRRTALSVLRRLQLSTQVSLQREPLYWLLYNAIVLTYSICRKAMALGYSGEVVEHLLWASVCMESSVPLMAAKYLRLRVCLYVAVCQCYYDVKQPVQAELFAREHLTKVTELARMEFESSSEATESSERAFREAAVKLEVMIFRQSVFETRKKIKSLFRPKIRPTIKELLLAPTSPSSPFRFQTEKLLSEMFQGHAAQFLAVLESLVDPRRRPLEQVVPAATAGLDLETTTDIYQELFSMGTDLTQKALDQPCVGTGSLMAAASQGTDDIPLQALVRFVCLAYSHKQQEVFAMLAERVTQAAMSSEAAQARAKGKSLQLLLAVEALRNDLKGQKTAAEDSRPAGEESSPEEPLDRVVQLLQHLREACCCRDARSREPEVESLVSSDYDLLLDAALFVWEVARPALARIHSHEWAACRHLLVNDTGQQYVTILEQLLEVFRELELWRVDPLLHGELGYKLACLQEARADLKHATAASQLIGGAAFILYDRKQLLGCLSVLRAGLKCVSQAREAKYRDQSLCHSGERITELEVLHADLLFALIRVQLKLASTIPPPPPPEGTQKPSSLKSKVRERQERLERRERLLSVLTAPEAQVDDESTLLQGCGKDRYLAALLAMQRAVVTPQLEQARREALLEEAFVHLSQLSQEQRASQNTAAASPSPPSTAAPPSPLLLHATSTSMAFSPAPFQPNSRQKISYYQLFGRPFTGSNVKVRLADKQLPGLGVEVPAGKGCVLEVRGLQPNEEYVFAVAAYTSRGELVGGAIGQTSRPHLANFPLPLLAAWGYCCQCAYTAGVPSVARQAAQVLWKSFTVPTTAGDAGDDDQQDLPLYQLSNISSTPAAIVRQFVQSVLVRTQLMSAEGTLLPSQLCVGGPLRASQRARIELARRLLAALEVAGMLNDASLVLQAVVMCYGLLVPLIQHSVAAMPVVQILLHCHAALSQLADIPESPLVCKHADTTASLHHMIATTAYHAGKVLLSWNKKAIFSSLMESTNRLLLLTMPSLTGPGTKISKDGPTGGSGLHQSSLLSGALGDPSLSSYTTMSSIFPGLLTQQKAGKKKKRARRKVTTAAEQLSDEAKSVEYKTFEAFLKITQGQSALEGVDITGQEDPVILHAVIAAMHPQAAYKEVYKFRRRPQYLEFFVHLASATVSRGQPERVLEWGQEAFSWLARRNELLLKPPPAPPQKLAAPQRRASKARPPSAMGFSTALVPVKRADSMASPQQRAGSLPKGARAKGAEKVTSEKKLSAVSSQEIVLSKRKHQPMNSQMVPVKRIGKLQLSLAPEVNKDNLENKAIAVLQSLLPELWRNNRCRKRLTLVSREELPWRVQANLLLGGCHLRALLQGLRAGAKTAGSAWDEGEGNPVTLVPPEWLRFESAGVLINGVIPIHEDSLPGITHKRGEDVSRERGTVEDEVLADDCRQPTPLQVLQQMMTCLQRAVVLAHRGNNWILLQNACHVLWNAMTTLVNMLTQYLNSQPAQEDCGGISLAAVYGLACKPLYFAASGLNDLLLHCGSHNASSPLPTPTSLHFTPVLDDCNTLDCLSARRLVLLAVHTLHTHQHWEKMIDVAIKFDDITNHSWAQQLVPVIKSAQEKLTERMQVHKGTLARKALDPAAHLDPGPEGHDVYGGVGHALALSSVPLDTRATMSRLGQGSSGGGERVLLHCRGMMIQYLAGASGYFRTEGPPDLPTSFSAKGPPSTPGSTPLVPQSPIQLSTVITAYDDAARQLLSRGERDLAAQAMHELGNLLYHSGSAKSAGHWWSEALHSIFQTTDSLNSWRRLVASTKAVESSLEGCGVWGCVVGGMLATKLAKYIYRNELDIQLEYTLMATALFKSLLASSLPHPLSELDYLSYQLEPGERLLPGIELFADRFRCDSITLLSCLQFCAQQLVSRKHCLKVQPVLWLYEHIAHTVCRDVQHTVIAKVLKLQTLTHLSLFAEALSLLMEIVSGAKLPQTCFEYDRPPDSNVATAKFSNNLPLTNSKNMKALATVFERALSPSLEAVYGETAVSRLALARAELYVALAATSTPIPQQTILKRVDQSSTRSSTALSTISAPSSTVSGCSDSTVSGAKPSGKDRAQMTPSHVKSQLLDHSEKLLVDLCHDLHDPGTPFNLELRTRGYLLLAEVALAQHHSSTAVQLSLAAMRLLQGTSSTARQSVAHDGLLDTRLWLECRVMLARSLVGSQPLAKSKLDSGLAGLLDCSEQCREGLRESEACGELELSAQLHSTAARHAMTQDPPDLEAVTVHAQTALQLLEALADLPPRARLLQSQTSILLADATCVQGGEGGSVEEEMGKVFQGLGTLLKEQIKQESPRDQSENIYSPHLPLFASTKLRLAHTFALLATQRTEPDKKQEYHSLAQKACEEGIETLKTSVFSDPCLMTELLFYNEWLQSTGLVPAPEGSQVHLDSTALLETRTAVADCGVDYRLAFTCYSELAQMLVASSKQSNPFQHSEETLTSTSTTTPLEQTSRASQAPSRAPSKVKESEPKGKAEKEWSKERAREAFLAWCSIRTTQHMAAITQGIHRLTAEIRNEEVTKLLPDNAVANLPDFALLDICRPHDVTDILATSVESVPVDVLAPSAQVVDCNGLSWFKVLAYTHTLLQKCFWQKSTLPATNSQWSLHYYCLTPTFYQRCRAMLAFLAVHFPPFLSLRIPSPVSALPSVSVAQKSTLSFQPAPGQQSVVPPLGPVAEPEHLSAGDAELNVMWLNPFVCAESAKETDVANPPILGLFAMNQKAIKFTSTMPVNFKAVNVNVLLVKTTVPALSELHNTWEELAVAAKDYLDSKATSRPLSRSPSKQKKSDQSLKPPSELQTKVLQAVQKLCDTFGLEFMEDQLPRLEPHSVAGISKVLQPFTNISVRGDTYYFFKTLLS